MAYKTPQQFAAEQSKKPRYNPSKQLGWEGMGAGSVSGEQQLKSAVNSEKTAPKKGNTIKPNKVKGSKPSPSKAEKGNMKGSRY